MAKICILAAFLLFDTPKPPLYILKQMEHKNRKETDKKYLCGGGAGATGRPSDPRMLPAMPQSHPASIGAIKLAPELKNSNSTKKIIFYRLKCWNPGFSSPAWYFNSSLLNSRAANRRGVWAPGTPIPSFVSGFRRGWELEKSSWGIKSPKRSVNLAVARLCIK